MPFTPSHAVVALPFIRTPLVPAAIAIGAMTPDLPLFVRGTPLTYAVTHSPGWLAVTVSVAFALLLVWRCLLRPAARELSPQWLASRLPASWDDGAAASARETFALRSRGAETRGTADEDSRRTRPLAAAVILLVSLVIGVLSHIAWDAFTHEGRAGVDAIPALDALWGPLTGYKWLQHVSSVAGLAILGVWALAWLRRARPVPAARILPAAARWGWWLSLPAVLVVAWITGLGVYGPLNAEWTPAHLAYRVLPPACAVWAAGTLALCLAVQLMRARTARRAPTASAA